MKWKRDPQDRYIRKHQEAIACWESGRKPLKCIGYDADEPQRADRDAYRNDAKFDYRFPLIEWGWGRDECIDVIDNEGICRPGKSSCFFCPSMKQHEIRAMAVKHPDLMARAIAMEDAAAESLTTIVGLGRTYSWRDVIATDDMFPEHFIDEACGCYDG